MPTFLTQGRRAWPGLIAGLFAGLFAALFAALCAGLLGLTLAPPVQAREPPAPVLAQAPVVRLAGGLLTVSVRDVGLVGLLDELSRQGGFAFASCLPCEQWISLRFDRLPLHQGLALILRDQNFALSWKGAVGAAMPVQLWLLPPPPGQAPGQAPKQARVLARPVATAVAAASHPWRPPSTLSIGTPEQRAEAAIDIARRPQPGAVASLTQALADSDRQVRQAAIESLAEIGGAEAMVALGLALRDGDARLREAAVNALGDLGGPKVMVLLRQAQQDASPFVRRAASETLADLQARKR